MKLPVEFQIAAFGAELSLTSEFGFLLLDVKAFSTQKITLTWNKGLGYRSCGHDSQMDVSVLE